MIGKNSSKMQGKKWTLAISILVVILVFAASIKILQVLVLPEKSTVGVSVMEIDDNLLVKNTGDTNAKLKVGKGITGFVVGEIEPGSAVTLPKGNVSLEVSQDG